jgi:hypothetical protein
MPRPLWSPGEQPTGPLFGDLQFIVAGVNRGGTTFVSNVLTSLGLRSKHEGLLTNDHVCREYSRYYDCEVSGGNVPMLPQVQAAKIPIFHLLRHPIGTLDSLWELWRHHDNFKDKYWVGEPDAPPAEAMGYWWMEHRRKIEAASPARRIYLEQPRTAFWIIGETMGYAWDTRTIAKAIDLNSDRRSWGARVSPKKWFAWQDLPDAVQRYAVELGYDIEA